MEQDVLLKGRIVIDGDTFMLTFY